LYLSVFISFAIGNLTSVRCNL